MEGEAGEFSGQVDILQGAVLIVGSGLGAEGEALGFQLGLGGVHVRGGHGDVAVGAGGIFLLHALEVLSRKHRAVAGNLQS